MLASAFDMDQWLWNQGHSLWFSDPYSKKSRRPHELDFLHAFHSHRALNQLATWLGQKTGRPIRMQCIWEDKNAYVEPLSRTGRRLATRELTDLAVIVQSMDSQRRLIRHMWLLQAKVCATPAASFSGRSSKHEIELMEGGLPFHLLDRARTRAISRLFDPNKFGAPIQKYWSFLTFHRDPRRPDAGKFGPYPVTNRWPGSASATRQIESFCGALVEMVANPGKRLGGLVQDRRLGSDEWSDLFYALMAHAAAHPTTGHARSRYNAGGSVLALAHCGPFFYALTVRGRSARGFYPKMARSHASLGVHFGELDVHLEAEGYDSREYWRGRDPEHLSRAFAAENRLPPSDGEPPGGEGDGELPEPGFGHIIFVDVGRT